MRTHGTAEAGTRTRHVQYVGQAALRIRYVHNAGGWDVPYGGAGAYVSARMVRVRVRVTLTVTVRVTVRVRVRARVRARV